MLRKNPNLKRNLHLALRKLEKEDKQILKHFDKLDNRTNTFLSISLGVFSLQISLLTGTIINICEKYVQEQNIIIMGILIFFITNILFNINSIINFKKSSKLSENLCSDLKNINKLVNGKIEENVLLKEEILTYHNKVKENRNNMQYKKVYINRGLNNIIVSIILIIMWLCRNHMNKV